MQIRSHKYIDRAYPTEMWENEIAHRWNYADFLEHRAWARDWISFDGVVYHAAQDRVYCGLTRFDGDIFIAWDRSSETFVELGFEAVMDRYDAKFHRSMQLTADGRSLYLATALLHDIDRYSEAPGGGIYRHDTTTGANTKLGIPIPHNYIQSALLDERRGVIYCMHFTPECMSVWDLATGSARFLGPLGSGMAMAQGENLALDESGCVWCGWGATKAWQSSQGADAHRLCKYDPEADRIIYHPHGLPRPDGGHGHVKVEGLFNLGDGALYASGGNGSLYRIDPDTGRAEWLGTPVADRRSRLTSLVLAPNGCAYGITGRDGACELLRFEPRTSRYELLGPVVAEDGNAMFQCHDIAIAADGTLFAGENDHPRRSSFLWEIRGATT